MKFARVDRILGFVGDVSGRFPWIFNLPEAARIVCDRFGFVVGVSWELGSHPFVQIGRGNWLGGCLVGRCGLVLAGWSARWYCWWAGVYGVGVFFCFGR